MSMRRNLISFGGMGHEEDDSSDKVHLHVDVALEVREAVLGDGERDGFVNNIG